MIGKGKNMQGKPILLDKDLQEFELVRIPLTEKKIQEKWLQSLIDTNPQILPVNEIESFYSPLISIGREIETKVGPIDNLFISPDGYITLVETKLWRNPQARREVVGQILDYAKELTKLTFEDLDAKIRKSNNESKGILEFINENYPIDDFDKQSLIDKISNNLKRGRFLLLIVGDGIRESVEDLVNFLNSVTQLDFTISIVELKIYKSKNNDTLIIPNTLFKTIEIGRTIVSFDENQNSINIQAEKESVIVGNKIVKQSTLNQEDFLQSLTANVSNEEIKFVSTVIDEFSTDEFICKFNKASVTISYFNPEFKTPIALFNIYSSEGVYVASRITRQLKDNDIQEEVGQKYLDEAVKLLDIQINTNSKGIWDKKTTIENFRRNYTKFKELVYQTKNNIIKQIGI